MCVVPEQLQGPPCKGRQGECSVHVVCTSTRKTQRAERCWSPLAGQLHGRRQAEFGKCPATWFPSRPSVVHGSSCVLWLGATQQLPMLSGGSGLLALTVPALCSLRERPMATLPCQPVSLLLYPRTPSFLPTFLSSLASCGFCPSFLPVPSLTGVPSLLLVPP